MHEMQTVVTDVCIMNYGKGDYHYPVVRSQKTGDARMWHRSSRKVRSTCVPTIVLSA